VKEADFEEEESVMQDHPSQVTQETCFSRGTSLPSINPVNDLRMSVGQKMLELFNQNKDTKKGDKKKKRKLNFKVDVDQIEKIINEPDLEEQEKQLRTSIKVEKVIEHKPARKQWGTKASRQSSRSRSRGERPRRAPMGLIKVKKSAGVDPILAAFNSETTEEVSEMTIVKPSDLGDSIKQSPAKQNFMCESFKPEEPKHVLTSAHSVVITQKEDDIAEFLPIKKKNSEKKGVPKKKGMLRAAPTDLIDMILAENSIDLSLKKEKENTTPSQKSGQKPSKVILDEEEEDDNPFSAIGQKQKPGNIFF